MKNLESIETPFGIKMLLGLEREVGSMKIGVNDALLDTSKCSW